MKLRSSVSASLRLCGIFILFSLAIAAQTIPAPKDTLGFTPGDDRKLASWASVVDYFKKLDAASDRVIFEEIGKSTMGAPFVYATISTPENLKNLERYKQINAKLADPRTFKSNDAEARKLVAQGKTIVLITCGIHSTEVGSTLSSMLIAHRLASSNEPEIQKILRDTVILLVPSLNPDGVDIVKNWYDKTLGTPYEGTSPPELYHKYVGHDNNRDWYAFTQVETQLTVDKIHNVWHPQIVHDIHQQGEAGSRLFLPPYMQPVEPNVPKQIVEGYTELGNYMAASPDDGYDPKVESPNFGPVWKGGEWRLRDITNYMTTAAFSLLNHAADNRERWLTRFYEIGKEAVRRRRDGEVVAYAIKDSFPIGPLPAILTRGGVTFKEASIKNLSKDGDIVLLIDMAQPYASFAKALLEPQKYPDLTDKEGHPIAPYDVTAHTLPLLFGVEAIPIYEKVHLNDVWGRSRPSVLGCGTSTTGPKIYNALLYRSHVPSMDEGWTRFILERSKYAIRSQNGTCTELRTSSLQDKDLPKISVVAGTSIIFPDQPPNQILHGYAKGTMPDEYTGGVGKEGVENLRKFVEAGGTLVFLNRASNFAIEQFNLPVRDVTRGLARKDFYIPGSILRTELDTKHPIAKGMPQQSIAWFENSPAFEVDSSVLSPGFSRPSATQTPPEGGTQNAPATVRIIARYPSDPKQILLSGWALGAEKIAGKAALVEFTVGKGKIVLFGFRPQYRGQSLATFPLLFNAISQNHLR